MATKKGRSRSKSVEPFRQKSASARKSSFFGCQLCENIPEQNEGKGKKKSIVVWKGKKCEDDDSTDVSTVTDYRHDNIVSTCDDFTHHIGDAALNFIDVFAACMSIFHEDCGSDEAPKSKQGKDTKEANKEKSNGKPANVTASDLRDTRASLPEKPAPASASGRESPATVATVDSTESDENDFAFAETTGSSLASKNVGSASRKSPAGDTPDVERAEIEYDLESFSFTSAKHVQTENNTDVVKAAEPAKIKSCNCCGIAPGNHVRLKLCSRCQSVYYCGAACQAQDWYGGHKNTCQPKEV